MASDASHMLEAALEQMDDIIAGSKAAAEFSNGVFELGSPGYASPRQVLQLAEDLRTALELQASEEDKDSLRSQVPSSTAQILMGWLERGTVNLRSPVNNETYQERLARLEGDKESLVLQVSVLTDQVEAQGEKIRDLESSLDEHHHKLNSTEEMLQQELLSRTALETQKLDLMDEVSYLKLKLVGMEEEQNDGEDKQHKAECVVNLISELQEQMCKFQQEISTRIQEKKALEKQADASSLEPHESPDAGLGSSDTEDCYRCREDNGLLQELRLLKNKVDELEGEKSQYERKLKATKAEIAELQQLLAAKDAEIESLQSQLLSRGPVSKDTAEREELYRRRLKDKHQELQRLKMGMESLLVANDEKDRRIEELTILLSQYRKIKEVMALAQVSSEKMLSGSSEEELSGSLKMRALTHKAHSDIMRSEMSSRGSSPLLVSPSSVQKDLVSRTAQMSPETAVSPGDAGFQNGQWTQPRMLSSSLEELQSGSLQKHVVGKAVEPVVSENRHIESNKYQTLPGKLSRSEENEERDKFSTPVQKSPDESEDSEFNLRKTEKMDDTTSSDLSPLSSGVDSGQQSPVSPENKKNQKGIKKFWGKIRRTQSGSLHGDDLETTEFRRGGLRATAGPRLARTSDAGSSVRDKNTPFSKWTTEQVCGWLEDYGLGQYVNLARQWVNDGQTLLSATPQDLEKEMGIKHPLHRKKLQLALRSFSTKVKETSSELDHIWVTRWLDDIGLPQYKDQFNEGRIDGRMLQYLTVNDLLFLKVTSQLHHLSIKCAIHVLHVNKFNPHCLKRRPGDENKTSPSEVVQWSNHRVMEWLRSVDLAEYAPNLRGSGVHGGLIILEPRFNSDTLAMLLNIPPQKTLLRRHLATNFNTLVGPQAQQEKREYMESSGYAPLTTTAKVRPKKLGFSNFGHLRKKKLDDSTDYICPMDPAPSAMNGAHRPYSGFRGLSPIFDAERLEQVGQKS
ncbi:liprin-beta-2b isoform X1 [Megalops cyprinoides]|uniref:liprin-beta-2b isoform X1 n=1 Tax=Megalops cyprinoides TaxID=118141 RepID=UPI0018647928|nr:liprin-beta-2b isoform X1 [Megalops cyprinoides]XP_036390463.1 liprin-beta-2b isoform X1 [Megalops cyprinoides]